MLILGLSGGLGHDAAACLVKDGCIVAMAEEERFIRRKQAFGAAPVHASAYCLTEGGITLSDLDCVAISWNPSPHPIWPTVVHESVLSHPFFRGHRRPPVEVVEHHVAHAASAFYSSGFDEAAILVVDGQGSGKSTSLAHGRAGRIKVLDHYSIAESLGFFYLALSNYLGFELGEEGKVMGLAPYGQPRHAFEPFELTDRGYRVNLPRLSSNSEFEQQREIRRRWLAWMEERLGPCNLATYPYDPELGRRSVDVPVGPREMDISASGQAQLEAVLLHLVGQVTRQTKCRRLVIAGGVGLNCSANGRMRRSGLVDDLYIFPASGDAGTSAGAALALYYESVSVPPFPVRRVNHAYWGPSYSSASVEATLNSTGLVYERSANVHRDAAGLLSRGAVLGWFQGRMEVGPRALGNRSILSAPLSVDSRDRTNRIKSREQWRPFAPALLGEAAHGYLDDSRPSPFMITSAMVREEKRSVIPAVVHVDGSCRPQIVERTDNPGLWSLLTEFYGCTGAPVLLNTSLNVKGEPLACNPADAIRTFFSCGLDALVLGDFIVTKQPSYRVRR
jgi:carbamoyltransferase